MEAVGMKQFLVSPVYFFFSFFSSNSRLMTSFTNPSCFCRCWGLLLCPLGLNCRFVILILLILFSTARCICSAKQLLQSKYYNIFIVVMFSKYLDYTQPATKAHYYAQGECKQKDVLIGQLKGELQELKQLEGDYFRLNELIHGLEGKYSLLMAEKERTDKEQRIKSDIDKKTIIELRSDIDDLRVQLQKANLVIQQLLRSNTNLKRQVDARSSEIQNFRYQIKQIENKNQRSNDENRSLALGIKGLKEERKRIEDECEALSGLLDESMGKLKNLEKDVRGTESGNARLEKTLYQAQKDNNKLVSQLKEKNEDLRKAEVKLKTVTNSIAELGITYKNLEQQTAKTKNDLDRNSAVLNGEVGKGKEIQGKIAVVQAAVRSQENQLDAMIAEEEKLREEHFATLQKNKGLNLEVDKVLALIAEYEQVNRELMDEIEYFMEQDQQARSMLDRGDVMRQILQGSMRKIAMTEESIRHLKC